MRLPLTEEGTAVLESVIFTLAVMFSDSCLGVAQPGEVCLQVLTPGTYSVVVRAEDGRKEALERRCASDAQTPCREQRVQGVVGLPDP
jgi:hypothetical protein